MHRFGKNIGEHGKSVRVLIAVMIFAGSVLMHSNVLVLLAIGSMISGVLGWCPFVALLKGNSINNERDVF